MCVIIVCTNKLPSLEILEQAEEYNSAGGGFAYPKNGKVFYEKNLKATQIFKRIMKLPNKARPVVIHFRIPTVGGEDPKLCHPFPITVRENNGLAGSADSVLFHNGHWSKWKEILCMAIVSSRSKMAKGPWSDSKALAFLLGKYGESFIELIDIWSDKVAVLTKNAVRLYGNFEEKDGIHYSNLFWEPVNPIGGLGMALHYGYMRDKKTSWNHETKKWDYPGWEKKKGGETVILKGIAEDDSEYYKSQLKEMEERNTSVSENNKKGGQLPAWSEDDKPRLFCVKCRIVHYEDKPCLCDAGKEHQQISVVGH